jgi:hypothetical protein
LLAETASPVAVTVIVAEANDAADEAMSVSVEDPFSALNVTGLPPHDAVTPLGNPVALSVTGPA